MTWLDERLFGWSRSAKRGTSAWHETASEAVSRVGTPNESDDEDAGDYDNVIGYLPTHDDHLSPGGLKPRSRSRNNSYADLQKLKLSPVAPAALAETPGASPTVELDGLHFHGGSKRARKASLSDDIPVDRIAASDPSQTFHDATDSLNDEMRQRKAANHGKDFD